MKRILLAGAFAIFSGYVNAGNLYCDITPSSVRVGQIGDSNTFTYVCTEDKCYNLGISSEERTKQFYSAALAAVSSGNKMRVTYFSSSASSCSEVSSSETAVAIIYSK